MIYEGTVQYTERLNSGTDKVKKEQYLIDNCSTFNDAETLLYNECNGLRDLDVIALKRCKINEILNKRNGADDMVFVCDIMDVFTDDEGQEKELFYKVALFAKDIKQAHESMDAYLAQGMNMQLVSLKRTKIQEIINF